jgi:hypothetical protein
MASSGISSAGFHAASQQAVQSLAPHKHSAHRAHSNSDIDAAGSSLASPASKTGKLGSKVNITA